MKIKTAFIGLGYRGRQLFDLLLHFDSFKIVAVADPLVDSVPIEGITLYRNGADDYIHMLSEQRPDFVFITSPWEFHIEHALNSLQHNCHIAIEIKGGLCINEYCCLEKMAAELNKRVYPLENTLFKREIMAVSNLVHAGVLGEIVCMKGGYRHDLRSVLVGRNGEWGNCGKGEGGWRSQFYETENADIYPTHGFAPLCMIADLRSQACLKSLVSFSSKSRGVLEYIRSRGGNENVGIQMGDVIITHIKTKSGILLTLTHDTTLPRPRSLDYEIQGVKGIWQGERRLMYIEDVSPHEEWEPDEKYISQYEHYLWKLYGSMAMQVDFHHQGMDYIMLKALEEDFFQKCEYPAGIEDLILWTSITPWSKLSIKNNRIINLE